MAEPYIKIEGLSYSYEVEDDDLEVLKDIDLEIEKGSFTAILGHNGSGKSTLAKLLNLVLTAQSGRIVIDGKEITSSELSDSDIIDIRRKIGMVFQNPDNQIVSTVVEEDVAFGPENLGMPPSEIRMAVDRALEEVGMKDFAKHSPAQLSGGQKQRIAIAGIIAMMPECIVFDEATAMLDPSGRRDVMNTIKRLNREKGITVLHITHNMDEAAMADRVVVINDGRIYMDGTPREVLTKVKELRSVGLDVPQVTELLYDLKESGIDISYEFIDCEGAADEILKALR